MQVVQGEVDRFLKAIIRRAFDRPDGSNPLPDCIAYARDQEKDPELRQVFTAVLDMVLAGRSLSRSMGKFPAVFGDRVEIVKAGEIAGNLDVRLRELPEPPDAPESG